jgi:hypothetical protein
MFSSCSRVTLLEVEVDLVSTVGVVFAQAEVFASSASATAVPAW